MIRLSQAGDTIVEVLIALTVVTSILGGAYITSNRSLNNNRQAQERGEALKIAESQLERLKSSVSSGNNAVFTASNSFCLDAANTLQSATIPADQLNNFDAYQTACTVQGGGPIYYTAVTRSGADTFTVTIRWDRAGGNGRDNISLIYRLPSLSFAGVRHA